MVEQPSLAVQLLVSISSLCAMLMLSLMTWHALRKRHPVRPAPIAQAEPVLEVVGAVPEDDDAWSEEEGQENEPMLEPSPPLPRGTVSGVRVSRGGDGSARQ